MKYVFYYLKLLESKMYVSGHYLQKEQDEEQTPEVSGENALTTIRNLV